MRRYLAFLRGAIMVGVVYRLGFLFTILGNIIYMIIAYFLWRSIYAGRETLNGLTFDQALLYVALGSTIFILLKTYTDWGMAQEIRDGTISVYLTKPIDYQLYNLFTTIGFASTSIVTVTLPTVIMLVFVFRIHFALGAGYLFFPVSLILAFIINFNLDYAVGLSAFYTESIWGISTTKEIIVSVLSGALLPLQFFPAAIQQILMVLPFQAMFFTPLMMVTKPDQDAGVFLRMLAVQALWAGVTYVSSRLLYNQAIKVLRVAGG
ncbi:MAG: ABC-2 family transporter protein [Anaerolineales bacterium]